MGFRIVRPDVAVLSLSDGKTITVRRRLNTEEERSAFKRSRDVGGTHDSFEYAFWMVVAYLLDWSDPHDTPPPIRGTDEATLIATIKAIDPDDFIEIKHAIESHRAAMVKERTDEKKTVTTSSSVEPISPLPSEPGGVLSGSVN